MLKQLIINWFKLPLNQKICRHFILFLGWMFENRFFLIFFLRCQILKENFSNPKKVIFRTFKRKFAIGCYEKKWRKKKWFENFGKISFKKGQTYSKKFLTEVWAVIIFLDFFKKNFKKSFILNEKHSQNYRTNSHDFLSFQTTPLDPSIHQVSSFRLLPFKS